MNRRHFLKVAGYTAGTTLATIATTTSGDAFSVWKKLFFRSHLKTYSTDKINPASLEGSRKFLTNPDGDLTIALPFGRGTDNFHLPDWRKSSLEEAARHSRCQVYDGGKAHLFYTPRGNPATEGSLYYRNDGTIGAITHHGGGAGGPDVPAPTAPGGGVGDSSSGSSGGSGGSVGDSGAGL